MTQSAYIFDVTVDTFDRYVLENSFHKPVLVDFWAEWCAPCKALFPVLSKITEEYAGELLLAKVDCEEQAALSERFGIRSLPTVVLFKDGQPVDGFAGMQSEPAIRAMLEPHVTASGSEPETAVGEDISEQIEALLLAGDAATAIALLQRTLAEQDQPALQLLLARALIQDQQLEAAQAQLEASSTEPEHATAVARARALLGFAQEARELPAAELLARRLETNPTDSEALYQGAILNLARQQYDQALAALLLLFQNDRSYAEGSAHRTLLATFEMLGSEHPLTGEYRRKLYQALY